ncbi:unnamed protein product [Closterium sp. NIES-54]
MHSPVRLPLSALPDVLLLVSSLLAMVVAGESWPLPKHAASASTASGKSPLVSASGSATMKPPAVPDPPALPAPAVAPLAPVRPEPRKVAPAAVVVPPVAPVLAAPVIAAAPAALGGDLALAVVSATTGGPAPAVVPAEAVQSAPVAPPLTFAGSSRAAEVPEATLGQLWCLSEGLRAVHLIQMYGHAGLSLGNTLVGSSRDECLDAADRLAELLAPMLAAPGRGGVAGIGQLGIAVQGLRCFLRAGTAADVIGASTAVVRELHRSLTGLLAVLDADQF